MDSSSKSSVLMLIESLKLGRCSRPLIGTFWLRLDIMGSDSAVPIVQAASLGRQSYRRLAGSFSEY